MDSLIFELQIVLYFQLSLSANVRHTTTKTMPVLTDIKAELSQEVASVRFSFVIAKHHRVKSGCEMSYFNTSLIVQGI